MVEEKRKHQRINALNLLSYVCLDDAENPIGEGMGRTLDISLGGLLIETHDQIRAKYILLLSVGFGDELMDIKCEVVYSRKNKSNMFESGVRFLETNERMSQIIEKLVIDFKKNTNGKEAW